MKKSMFVILVIGILTCNAIASPLFQSSVEEFLPIKVSDRVFTDSGISLSLVISEPIWTEVETGADPALLSSIAASGRLEVEGYPAVPIATSLFRLPPQSGVVVEVFNAEYETYTDVEYAIYTGNQENYNFARIEDTGAEEDSWYPGVLAEAGSPAIMREFRVANLVTYPVQVNTARREVRVYNSIELSIRYEGTDDRNTIDHWPTHLSKSYLPFYRLLLDWDENELDEYTLYRGSVQVVMQNDDILMDEMEDWFEWKRQKGWTLELLTDDDVGSWTSSNIQNELEDRWEEADLKYDYIVIVGDASGSWDVPESGSAQVDFSTGYGDNDYACVAGNDKLPECGYGRISVESTNNVATYVNKVIAYERDPDLDNTDWYLKGCVAVASASSGIETVFSGRYQRWAMLDLGYTQVDTAWVSPWGGLSGAQVRSAAISAFNDGIGFYGCRGYISAGLSTTEINNLNNDFMTPVAVDITCGTGNWTGWGVAISETYMRAGSANSPRGGIGGFGMDTSHTMPRFNNLCSTASSFSMHVMQNPCMGDMMYASKYFLFVNYDDLDGDVDGFLMWYNLMGDPTVWLYTDIPEELTVSASEEIELGQNGYEVSVEDDEGFAADAWVTLYKVDDNEDIVVTAETDNSGHVILDVPVRFEGEAVLTVTKQNCAPYRLDVSVVSPTSRIGVIDYTVVDDGTGGTSGDGDGIAEAGETVGLEFTLQNFGDTEETNIEITATSEDNWIDNTSGAVTLTSLASGSTGIGEGLILVEIVPEAQHEWILHLAINIDSELNDYSDIIPLTVSAPRFALVQVDPQGNLDPGETRFVDIEVINIGGSIAAAGVGHLVSNGPYVSIIQNDPNYPAMNVGVSSSATFQVEIHESAIPGMTGLMSIIFTTESGQVDTLGAIQFVFGTRESTDPVGPDSYGYFAFDNTDTDYQDHVPDFDWVEINPDVGGNDFDGEELDINDTSDDGDEAVVVELPFDVQYYGEIFSEMTVCSNGWIAMGSQADLPFGRNMGIPSPYSPDYMIAPYWDERRTNQGGIYYYYDEVNSRIIVEWHDITDYHNNNPCTFEVIIYGQDVRPTYSGDNDILFQYEDMSHTQGGDHSSADVFYWTTGIQNGSQTDGLMLAYWNQLMPGAASITDGRSILFSTNVAQITGAIDGTVTDLRTGDPVEGATIHSPDYLFVTMTDAQGYFLIEEVPIGTHTLELEVECFNDYISGEITVFEEETTTVDIELLHPEIALDPGEVNVELFPDEQVTSGLNLTNPGEGTLAYSAYVYFQDPQPEPPITGESFPEAGGDNELDELFNSWDWAYQFDLDENETHNNGVIFWNKYFITSGSNNLNPGDANKFYQYDRYGEAITSVDQPVPADERSNNGILGLAWDGDYLYGADNGKLYQMEIQLDLGIITSIDLVDSWEIPANPARYVAYDPESDLFWLGDHGSEIRGVNRAGEIIYEYGNEYSARGASWYDDGSDFNLYLIGRSRGETTTYFVRMNPETGDTEVLYTYETLPGDMVIAGATITPDWNPLAWTIATVVDYDPVNGIQILVLDDHIEYLSIDNPNGSLDADSTDIINLNFDGSGLPYDTYRLYLGFNNDACDTENNHIPITMLLPDTTTDVNDDLEAQPLDWSFDGAYPNPFNPVVTVEFSLLNRVEVTASIYNLLGQEVGVLASGQMVPGRHSVSFDGSHLSSGMYFLRFQAGPINEVRKLVLMK